MLNRDFHGNCFMLFERSVMASSILNNFMMRAAGVVCAIALAGSSAHAQTPPGSVEHDIRFEEFIEPVPWNGADSGIYRGLVVSIPVKVRFSNAGTKTQTEVPVTITYRDSSGSIRFISYGTIHGEWEPGTDRVVGDSFFLSYLGSPFGSYSVEVCVELAEDEISENNCSHRRIFAWSANPYEIRAGNPEHTDASPLPGRTYAAGDSIAPHATYLNMGREILAGAAARMIIHGPSGRVIYDDSTLVLPIDTVRRMRRTYFPAPLFLNDGAGTYHVTSIGTYKDDPFKKDDTASWTFQAGAIAGAREGEPGGLAAAAAIAAYPNPASRHLRVAYRIPGGASALLRMYGADGREVDRPAAGPLSGEGTTTVPADLLRSGSYTIVLELSDGTRKQAEIIIRH